MLSEYPKIYALGHPALDLLFSGPVLVEEKVDGSQFSFSLGQDGQLQFRSHGAHVIEEAPPKLFVKAVAAVQERKALLNPGWIYRAEFLAKPKHNTLSYERVPRGNLIIFDITNESQRFLDYGRKAQEAERLGFERVPVFLRGKVSDADALKELLKLKSILGGTEIEGVVVKPVGYALYGRDGKVLMGKFVSEKFKEVHRKEWKMGEHAPVGSKVERLLASYRTEARWEKAIQKLREEDRLLSEPKDIGGLIVEVQKDVAEECGEEIRHELWKVFKYELMRTATRGLPEWYKLRLLSEQKFSSEGVDNEGKSG